MVVAFVNVIQAEHVQQVEQPDTSNSQMVIGRFGNGAFHAHLIEKRSFQVACLNPLKFTILSNATYFCNFALIVQIRYMTNMSTAIGHLQAGNTILYPTDTVWGLGCDATNAEAVQKIYAVKKRAESKALIVLLDSVARLVDFVEKVPDLALDMIEKAVKPTTIIYPNARNLAPNLLAKDGTIAIRIASDGYCRQLINEFGKPLVSTSANISGQPTPMRYEDIALEIINAVDYVVPYIPSRTQKKVPPSTIIKIGAGGKLITIRE